MSRRRMAYRPHPFPSPHLPLAARSVGTHDCAAGYVEDQPARGFWQVFWGVSGSLQLRCDGRRIVCPADSAVLLGPHDPHHLHCSDPWLGHWWTMDGSDVAGLIERCGLRRGEVWPAGPCPVALIDRLESLIGEPGPTAEAAAAGCAYELLVRAASPLRADRHHPLVEQVRSLIRQRAADPQFDIQELARALGVHRSLVHQRCRQSTGASPSAMLTAHRLAIAVELLTDTSLPIGEVARRSGFADPAYFARRLRQLTGRSPRSFR